MVLLLLVADGRPEDALFCVLLVELLVLMLLLLLAVVVVVAVVVVLLLGVEEGVAALAVLEECVAATAVPLALTPMPLVLLWLLLPLPRVAAVP